MGYKQPGFGNGEKAPSVPNSPLNILGRKKRGKARESEGRVDDLSGVTISANQYGGKTNKQIKKLKEKAADRAAKAEKKAAGGKKLSKRQQDAIAERDYNIKRESEKTQWSRIIKNSKPSKLMHRQIASETLQLWEVKREIL